MNTKIMHRGKKLAAALLAAAFLMSSLTGCAGGNSSADHKGGSSSSSLSSQSGSSASTDDQSSHSDSEDSQSSYSAQADSQSSSSASEGTEQTREPVDVRVVALKGPTAMGMVQFMDEADKQNVTDEKYQFTIAAAPEEVTPMIVQGAVDIAAVPANLASVLYNNTEGAVQVLTVNTLGVLYIVENGNTIQSVKDLQGKTIYASGKGATPEYALQYILKENGLTVGEDVTIEWKSEHAECVAALASDNASVAMLPQPFATTALVKNDALHIVLDLTEEWAQVQGDKEKKSSMITGATIVRREFAEEHPEAVENFLAHYKESVEFVNANTDEAAALIGGYEIVAEQVAKKALPECNIVFLAGEEMQEKLSGYLNVLYDQNPKAIGGKLPGDEFYYIGQENK